MALEEYIKQVKEIWTSYTLDLVNYQNKCRLIRFVLIFEYGPAFDIRIEGGMICSISAAKI